jgi:hypothetical protein
MGLEVRTHVEGGGGFDAVVLLNVEAEDNRERVRDMGTGRGMSGIRAPWGMAIHRCAPEQGGEARTEYEAVASSLVGWRQRKLRVGRTPSPWVPGRNPRDKRLPLSAS